MTLKPNYGRAVRETLLFVLMGFAAGPAVCAAHKGYVTDYDYTKAATVKLGLLRDQDSAFRRRPGAYPRHGSPAPQVVEQHGCADR